MKKDAPIQDLPKRPDSLIISKERIQGLMYLKDGRYVPFWDLWVEAMEVFIPIYLKLNDNDIDPDKIGKDETLIAAMTASFGKVVERIYDKDAMVQALLITMQELLATLQNWIGQRKKGWTVAADVQKRMRGKLSSMLGMVWEDDKPSTQSSMPPV